VSSYARGSRPRRSRFQRPTTHSPATTAWPRCSSSSSSWRSRARRRGSGCTTDARPTRSSSTRWAYMSASESVAPETSTCSASTWRAPIRP
jgi:hypothetical protein